MSVSSFPKWFSFIGRVWSLNYRVWVPLAGPSHPSLWFFTLRGWWLSGFSLGLHLIIHRDAF